MTVTNAIHHDSVIAVSAPGADCGPFRAVLLRNLNGKFQLVWKKTAKADQSDWESFVRSAGAETSPVCQTAVGKVVALSSVGIGFYRIQLPPVTDAQVPALVKMQAEAFLPVAYGQTRIAWRADDPADNKRPCTIAAVTRASSERLVDLARRLDLSSILLAAEGIVRAWMTFYGGTGEKSVILHTGPSYTTAILACNGRLEDAVVLDADYAGLTNSAKPSQTHDLFIQDLRSALERFTGPSPKQPVTIYVLGEDCDISGILAGHINRAGFQARVPQADTNALTPDCQVQPTDIGEYADCLGAALLMLEPDGKELDLFKDITDRPGEDKQKQFLASLKRPMIIAAVIAAVFLIVSYAIDKAQLRRMEKYINTPHSRITVAEIIDKHQNRKLIAAGRPDMLELLAGVNESASDAILIDSFEFQKGRPVVIAGSSPGYEQLYDFQKKLEAKKNISDVKIQSPSFDEKKGRLIFKIAFHYGNFTGKK